MTHPGTPGSTDPPVPPLADSPANRPPAGTPAHARNGQGNEQHEFACFYHEHFTRLVAYLVYQGAAAHLAAGIAQEAMTIAYPRWSEITSPRACVYKVAYRAYLRHAIDAPELPVGEVPEPTAVLPRPAEADAWIQEQQIIQVLRALPPRQRQVLALTIDGWTPSEIAEMLGIDSAAARANLKKARRNAGEHRRRTEEEVP
jgi:DNA-directed RNA polymerase specialized sigma24 family protein